MPKIVLDTNVVISALITDGIPFTVVNEFVFEGKATVCISNPVFEEYIEVLNRPKFSRFKDFQNKAEIFINKIENLAEHYIPDIRLDVISDEADNRFLELSVFAEADYLITGNTNDFKDKKYGKVRIVSPREFLNELE